ncbi:MAG: hypothetical protein HYU66_10980 [Armatimonadetes bacterium]|nr:hypothetical protein [Armatimonadota bacterium]
MTPKQRVQAAIRHEEPDRVPIGEFAVDYAIIEKVLGRRSYFRGKAQEIRALWDGHRDEVVESAKHDIVEFVRRTGMDQVAIHMVPCKNAVFERPRQLDERTWEDSAGNVLRYSDQTHDLMLLQPGEHPEKLPQQPPPDGTQWELFDHVVAELGETHYLVARGAGGAPTVGYFTALGLEEQLMAIVERPDDVKAAQLRHGQAAGEATRRALERGADAFFWGEDYGFNSGPMMSPRHFQELYVPGLKLLCEGVHAAGAPVFFHSCGNLEPILEPMVDAGIDVYQSIQPIEPILEYKRLYGHRLTLMGGMDLHLLARGTPDEVRSAARLAIRHLAPGGGFILASSHSLGVATQYDNLMAMLEVAHTEGGYGA